MCVTPEPPTPQPVTSAVSAPQSIPRSVHQLLCVTAGVSTPQSLAPGVPTHHFFDHKNVHIPFTEIIVVSTTQPM